MSVPFRVERAERCKVCHSPLCDTLSGMLLEGRKLREIVEFAKSGGLSVSNTSLRRHRRHIVSAARDAVEDAVEDVTAERLGALARGDLISDFDFLDLIRDQAVKIVGRAKGDEVEGCLVKMGDTSKELFLISLAIRAVGIRRHVEGTSSFERELADLLARAKRREV